MIKLEKFREKLEDYMLGLKETQKKLRMNETF